MVKFSFEPEVEILIVFKYTSTIKLCNKKYLTQSEEISIPSPSSHWKSFAACYPKFIGSLEYLRCECIPQNFCCPVYVPIIPCVVSAVLYVTGTG